MTAASAGGTAIEVAGLTKRYHRGTTPALANVSLAVQSGEILGIIGPNGAGKTTLVGCLLGLLRPDEGHVLIDGLSPDDLELRRAIGYLPERLHFDRWMSGRQFLAYQHALAGRPPGGRRDEVDAVLTRVAIEQKRWNSPVSTYSRGTLQRLGLAQALIGEPRYLFLDEPASGVDPAGVILFREILAGLKQRGVTVVLNSHQLEALERVCDRVVFITAGEVKAIENLRVTGDDARVVAVRWLVQSEPAPAAGETAAAARTARLVRAAAAAEVQLLDSGAGTARFAVNGDRAAAALVAALVAGGLPVIEVAPEAGRLEKFFRPSAAWATSKFEGGSS
jgi:ABC-2 type transport system ATP-binding protein